MVKKKYIFALIFVMLAVFMLTSCAPGNIRWDQDVTPGNEAGFWAGIWHGLIIIITFIISLFTDKVRIYELNNSGWPYNLGFIIGLCISLGGGFKSAKRRKKRKARQHDWNEIAGKIEEKVHAGIKSWLDEHQKEEKDWDEIADKIEEKIKRILRDWAEK
jgi:hypothetical protein